MEPFFIACTTCQSRLKVRDSSAIGQILACPKCGSMVLIAAPTAASASDSNHGQSATSSPAATTGAPAKPFGDARETANTRTGDFEDLDTLFREPAGHIKPKPTTPVVAKSATRRPNVDPASKDTLPEGSVTNSGSLGESFTAGAPVEENEAPADSPPAVVVNQKRQLWFVAVAGLAGFVLAIGLCVAFIAWMSSKPGKPTALSKSPIAVSDEPSTPKDENVAPEDLPDVNVAKPTPAPPPDTEKIPVEPVGPSEPADAPPPSEPAPKPNEDMPLELKPKDESPPANSDAPFDKFADLFGPRPTKPAAPDSDPAPPAEKTEEPSTEIVLPRPTPRSIDVAARLADRTLMVEFSNTPLLDFLQTVSDLSTLPITLDPDALMLRRIASTAPISVKLENKTTANLLTESLKPLGLAFVASETGVLITIPPVKDNDAPLPEVSHKVGDLTGNDAERTEQLGNLIVELVASDSWSANGGRGEWKVSGNLLVVQNSQDVQLRVVRFCDQLRVARGTSPTHYNVDALKPGVFAKRAETLLAKPVTRNFSRPTRLTTILKRLTEVTGAQFLVDWSAIAEQGWTLDTEITFTVENQPLRDALVTMLSPMDLTFRVLDDTTLQITTPAVMANQTIIETHSIARLLGDDGDSEPIITRLRAAMDERNFRDLGGQGLIVFDAPSKCLIVLLPDAEQRTVARLLTEWAE